MSLIFNSLTKLHFFSSTRIELGLYWRKTNAATKTLTAKPKSMLSQKLPSFLGDFFKLIYFIALGQQQEHTEMVVKGIRVGIR